MDTRKPLILFDGVCNLCNGFVQFIIRRDPLAHFQFGALQSEAGQSILSDFGLANRPLSTIVLISNQIVFVESDAVLEIARHLEGWKWIHSFQIIPRGIRNIFYRIIAASRYKIFGRKAACMIPSPDLKARFIE